MGDATCIADNCTNKPADSGRGNCHKHYLAGLADGSLARIRKSQFEAARPSSCSIDGCPDAPSVRGMCRPHYSRWWKYGDPTRVVVRARSVCVEVGCDKVVNSRGLCSTHSVRLRKHGSTAPPKRKSAIERFHELVDTSAGPDGCHPWMGNRDGDGYGNFFANRQPHRATRWILGYTRGHSLSSEEWALHHCDNPPCVNLAHLYIGDASQNAADRERRGRGGAQKRALPTHCRNRHEYTPDNIYVQSGKRQCRTCRAANLQRKYQRLKLRRAAA